MKLKILGPPGCGKTTTLLTYLQRELEAGVPPERIAFLTFTRAARKEALERTNKTDIEFPYLKTIHSICYHQLGIGRDQIVKPENLRDFGRKIGVKLTGNDLDPWIEEFTRGVDAPTKDDMLLQANHKGRHRKTMLKDSLEGISTEIDYKYASWFTKAYRTWKDSYGLMDYTDLLDQFVGHGKPLNIDVIFVDEAQDLSLLQWDVVKVLGENAQRWYIAGDDDQAIFNWAGADSSAFQDFEANRIEVLGQSYRCSKAVYLKAMSISRRIKNRLPKPYSPTESEGEVLDAGYLHNIDFSKKTYLLFRNHYRGAELAQILRNENIPYIGKGSPLMSASVRACIFGWYYLHKKKEIDTSTLKVMINYMDEDYTAPGVRNLIKEKKRLTIDQVLLEPNLGSWDKVLATLPGIEDIGPYIRKYGFMKTGAPRVELMSIHQSKGREAHTIVLDPEMSRAVWLGMIDNADDEHRVWYVACTRAAERLYFLMPDGPYSYRF